MKKENDYNRLTNPHDKLFREVWSDLENVQSFLEAHLPDEMLRHMKPETLEICKDSFIEKELQDYFSDMLYKVTLSGTTGYLYVLFEHKSYEDKYLHLQLLEYMTKIWRLHLKQQRGQREEKTPLPIVLPLVIYHGKRAWPEHRTRFSSLIAGPVEAFSSFIPDFSFKLYDLPRLSDEEIKGSIMVRVMQLLFKHHADHDFMERLPDILVLMQKLMSQDTGLQCLETVLRYLFGTIDDASTETIKTVIASALSKKEGDYVMTLAEKIQKQGEIRGEIIGKIQLLQQIMNLPITPKNELKKQTNEELQILFQEIEKQWLQVKSE